MNSNNRHRLSSLVILVLLFVLSAGALNNLYSSPRRARAKGELKNFHEFSRNIYRGAQPTKEGFGKLKKMGIITVIDLLPGHSDEKLVEGLQFNYFQIPVKLWRVDEGNVIQFLKIVTNTKYYPVFIHCDDGEEKTSLMVALYRVYAQNWTTYDATKEFCKAGLKKDWNSVTNYLESINRAKIKEAIRQ